MAVWIIRSKIEAPLPRSEEAWLKRLRASESLPTDVADLSAATEDISARSRSFCCLAGFGAGVETVFGRFWSSVGRFLIGVGPAWARSRRYLPRGADIVTDLQNQKELSYPLIPRRV